MSISAMKQALEALEHSHAREPIWKTPIKETITSLRQAIAEAEKQEPVAWMHKQGNYEEPSFRQLDDDEISRGWEQYPLYTHPSKREPLTDEKIVAIVREASRGSAIRRDGSTSLRIARAIEAAHGIKEKNK